jgi:Zn-dependent protease with chaperone function
MVRLVVIVLGLVGIVGVAVNAVTQERERPTDWVAAAVLQYFESVADFDALLRQLRRPAPPAKVRVWVMKNLPEEGQLTPTVQETAKLQALLPVIAFHGRERDMELRLITAGGLAFVGLHARTVLLISREALRVIDTNELVAIAAHELGHDYLWHEYADAQRENNMRRLQELELRCDGFAVITMTSLRVGPERLVSAVTKLARYNEHMFGKLNDPRYVPLDQRIRFIRSVAKLTGARDGR